MKVRPDKGRAIEDESTGGDGPAPDGTALDGWLSSVVVSVPCGLILSLKSVRSSSPSWSRLAGVSALLTSKGVDVAVTSIALLASGRSVEVNPLARAVYDVTGLEGIVALGLIAVGAVVLVTEIGAATVARDDAPAWAPVAVRVLGYGPLTVWWLLVAIYNILQLSAAVAGVVR